MISRKNAIIAVIALVVTLVEISIMRGLVRERGFFIEDEKRAAVGKFIRVKKSRKNNDDLLFETPEQSEAPPAPPPEETPPEPEVQETEEINISVVNPVSGSSLFGVSFSDGDYLPIVKVPADYPEEALRKGIEGWVLVSFTVSKTGAVKDPRVVKAQPAGFFERAALRAVKRFKYKPKIIGGEAIEVEGVTNRIVFKIEDVK
ncbi:energy transducer TonB [Candidatus Mycalebacterium sp.]